MNTACVWVWRFQLMDDALDYSADTQAVGKPVGHDLEEGKITLPLIHAMRNDAGLLQTVQEIAERGNYAEDERERVRQAVGQVGGLEQCLEAARDYAARAKRALPADGNAKVLKLLEDLADFSAQRPY